MKTTKEEAQVFASRWYQRPGYGCDESTLAVLLEELLNRREAEIRLDERERVQQRFALLISSGWESGKVP